MSHKQIYILDFVIFLGALAVSANDVMWFWYCVGGYVLFKICVIYSIIMFRNDTIESRVEERLLALSRQASLQLARGDHSPMKFDIKHYHATANR